MRCLWVWVILLFMGPLAFAEGHIEVGVSLSPAGSFKARTKEVSGAAYKSGGGIVAENVMIDLRELTSGISLRDKHMKEHLKVKEYPRARLVKAVGKDGKGKATIQIAGKKQVVNGTYKIAGKMLHAEFKISLKDLEIKGVKYMGAGVKDEVIVKVDLPIQAGAPRSSASED